MPRAPPTELTCAELGGVSLLHRWAGAGGRAATRESTCSSTSVSRRAARKFWLVGARNPAHDVPSAAVAPISTATRYAQIDGGDLTRHMVRNHQFRPATRMFVTWGIRLLLYNQIADNRWNGLAACASWRSRTPGVLCALRVWCGIGSASVASSGTQFHTVGPSLWSPSHMHASVGTA
jgi:hypothetical protein